MTLSRIVFDENAGTESSFFFDTHNNQHMALVMRTSNRKQQQRLLESQNLSPV